MSKDGHFEMVFNAKHVLQNATNNPEDMGTYNYVDYRKIPVGFMGHLGKDVITWITWGNASNDSTTELQRIKELTKGGEECPEPELDYMKIKLGI